MTDPIGALAEYVVSKGWSGDAQLETLIVAAIEHGRREGALAAFGMTPKEDPTGAVADMLTER
jgi:hypothetical protein